MTDLRAAAQQALEALEDERYVTKYTHIVAAITALKAALEQPEQEPVAWMSSDRAWMWSDYSKAIAAVANIPTLTLIPLYTAPPAAQPEQEPTPWRDMVVVSLVREGVNKHKARELADHFAAERNNG